MSIRATVIIILALILLGIAYGEFRYHAGWNAHAEKIVADAAKQKEAAEKEIQPIEQKAAQEAVEAKIIYRTITRDVVKYVQSPNRTVCRLDDDSVRLRQQAIDAANSITGFDAATVQGK
ncbi:hypothetical protein F6Q07_23080 [Pectobacterium parmentieri]|uniref:hypothetical protein n=1 Tax=Pectobacterium parmentieri TaxID=1905730 RepID=UPI0018E0383F|nr:hypothetical protein [Pectobacterium parmentieri]MBI0520935.1 hypothetical protein [Pectobacterium parmentieri]QQA77050.1 hypothetical protein JBL47_05460 [Pectobacterium parmentieri]